MRRKKSLEDYEEKLKNKENDKITLCFNLERKKDRIAYQKVLLYMQENGTKFKEALVDLLSSQSIPEYKEIDTSYSEEKETLNSNKKASQNSKKKDEDNIKKEQEEEKETIGTEDVNNSKVSEKENKDEFNIDDLIDNPDIKQQMKEVLKKSYSG